MPFAERRFSIQKNMALGWWKALPEVFSWSMEMVILPGNLFKFSKYTVSIWYHKMLGNVRISMATRDRVAVKALASQKWGPSLNPGLDDTYGLSLLLVLVFSFRWGIQRLLVSRWYGGYVLSSVQKNIFVYLFCKTWSVPGYLKGAHMHSVSEKKNTYYSGPF